jgi:hypothetical protein
MDLLLCQLFMFEWAHYAEPRSKWAALSADLPRIPQRHSDSGPSSRRKSSFHEGPCRSSEGLTQHCGTGLRTASCGRIPGTAQGRRGNSCRACSPTRLCLPCVLEVASSAKTRTQLHWAATLKCGNEDRKKRSRNNTTHGNDHVELGAYAAAHPVRFPARSCRVS